MAEQLKYIGQRIPQYGAIDKARGKAQYSQDIFLPNMLYGAILESPHAHAKVISVDTSKAEALSGVKAVISCMEDTNSVLPVEAKYVGQEIAAVAAMTKEIAEEAIKLIEVEYEVLEAKLGDWRQHEKAVCNYMQWSRGDIEQGFTEANAIVEGTFEMPRQQHTCAGPAAVVAFFDNEGKLTVYECDQGVHLTQSWYASALKMPLNKVRVATKNMGGGFGSFAASYGGAKTGFVTCLLAKKTGLPVKISRSRRQDSFWRAIRGSNYGKVKIGAKQDGTLTAMYHDTPITRAQDYEFSVQAGQAVMSGYKCPNAKFESYTVSTNYSQSGYYRGVGNAPSHPHVEISMDELAEKLDISPLEFRLKNAQDVGTACLNDKIKSSSWPTKLRVRRNA
jgi:CO/xanthine dehydrogenase Mo-binding subunit